MALDASVSATSTGAVRAVLGIGLAALVLSLCLFGDCPALKQIHNLDNLLGEVTVTLRDPGVQWMVFVCAGMYLVGFLVLRWRLGGPGSSGTRWNASLPREVWLLGLVGIAAFAYALDYTQTAKSTQALTLVGAAMVGQGAALWEGRKKQEQCRRGSSGTVLSLIVLLAGAAVWQGETGHLFQYRGQVRWSGPWDNPNIFGMLMGVGFVLAVGRLVQSQSSAECRVVSAEFGKWKWCALRWLRGGFLLAAVGMMGLGLVKSYSRGAWVATAVGLGCLGYQTMACRTRETGEKSLPALPANSWAASRGLRLAVILVSLCVSAFWSLRSVEWLPARRVVSVGNVNDFSWRNRLAAWEGALQMMADRPWFGFGWNQPERVYDQYYRPARLTEGAAIQMNDYFMLGTTLGVPALMCFLMYVGLSLGASPRFKVQNPKSGNRNPYPSVRGPVDAAQDAECGRQRTELVGPPTLVLGLWTLDSAAVCRAGAVVLLVGFWFDGGLFNLATAATFWILLEVGAED